MKKFATLTLATLTLTLSACSAENANTATTPTPTETATQTSTNTASPTPTAPVTLEPSRDAEHPKRAQGNDYSTGMLGTEEQTPAPSRQLTLTPPQKKKLKLTPR